MAEDKMSELSNYLHIYGQREWHDESYILGDTKALTALRDAIDVALKNGDGRCLSFANDGEGYNTLVVKVEDSKLFEQMHLPYTGDYAKKYFPQHSDAFNELINQIERKQ